MSDPGRTRAAACPRDSRVQELPRYLWGGTARQGRSGRGPQFTRFAHHLLDLGDVLLFQLDLLARVLLQPNALVAHEIEQLVVRAQRRVLVLEGLMEDLPDLVLVRFDQLADLEGRVTAERRNVLAGDRGVVHAFDRLVPHPADDRDARVAEYHQRVVDVAHDAGELELEDRVEGKDDEVPVDLVVLAGHGLLLYSERNTRTPALHSRPRPPLRPPRHSADNHRV